ncbi:MAG TPA: maltotransferase domain-containing protein, partial [Paracoccaceae bacterium]|nr:maltotransferase domain-containing protein [Paracoccaceae bacterium]
MALAAERVAIENLSPAINGGRFPAKGVIGRAFIVEADIFSDGHDRIGASLQTRPKGAERWDEVPMLHIGNDRWRGRVRFDAIGPHEYRITAWRDLFASWQEDTAKKEAAGQPIGLELIEARELIADAVKTHEGTAEDRAALDAIHEALEDASEGAAFALLMNGETTTLMRRAGPRIDLTEYRWIPVWIDREKALVSAWYELFPRSMSFDMERHGTFDDVIERLSYIRD